MMTDNGTRPESTDQRLITSEPSSRAVLGHRLMAMLIVAGLLAAVAYVAIADPFDLIGSQSSERLDTGAVRSASVSVSDEDGGARSSPDGGDPASPATGDSPAVAVNDQRDDATGDDATVDDATVEGLAPVTYRFVNLPTTRILDTRQAPEPADPIPAGESAEAEFGDLLPAGGAETVVLSVNVAMAQGPGPITVSAGGRPVTAIDAAGPGQMTTNLVFVPRVPGQPLVVTTAGGGHLVVDVVGYFEPADGAAAGRFVSVATQRLARLITEVDGREAVFSPLSNPGLPASGVESVVVRITADVGGEGGMVRLGTDLESLPNTMMWAATSGDDRTRQGVAVVSLSELDELAFTYNGGSILDVDAVGYFTDGSALETEAGLFVPATGAVSLTIDVTAGEPAAIDAAGALQASADDIGAVVVNAFATSTEAGDLYVHGPGQERPASPTVELGAGARRFGFTITEVDEIEGTIVIDSEVDAALTLDLSGYFTR